MSPRFLSYLYCVDCPKYLRVSESIYLRLHATSSDIHALRERAIFLHSSYAVSNVFHLKLRQPPMDHRCSNKTKVMWPTSIKPASQMTSLDLILDQSHFMFLLYRPSQHVRSTPALPSLSQLPSCPSSEDQLRHRIGLLKG